MHAHSALWKANGSRLSSRCPSSNLSARAIASSAWIVCPHRVHCHRTVATGHPSHPIPSHRRAAPRRVPVPSRPVPRPELRSAEHAASRRACASGTSSSRQRYTSAERRVRCAGTAMDGRAISAGTPRGLGYMLRGGANVHEGVDKGRGALCRSRCHFSFGRSHRNTLQSAPRRYRSQRACDRDGAAMQSASHGRSCADVQCARSTKSLSFARIFACRPAIRGSRHGRRGAPTWGRPTTGGRRDGRAERGRAGCEGEGEGGGRVGGAGLDGGAGLREADLQSVG